MSRIVFTLAEDMGSTSDSHFAVRYSVDENDCFDFARGLEDLGHHVYFVNWRDLEDGVFRRVFSDNEKRFVAPMSCAQFDLAFVYKMEGFLFDLKAFFQMVAQFEKDCPTVINHPKTIRHNIDKHYLWDLERAGIRIIPTIAGSAVHEKCRHSAAKFVIKPRWGERGNGIFLLEQPADLKAIAGLEHDYIAQTYMPQIRAGERSLVFLGHDYQHAVIKKPAPANPAEFRCNESLGGTVEIYEPTKHELDFAREILRVYQQELGCPVHFSRIDLIEVDGAPMLVEAELLNPSIYANYSQKGAQFGKSIADYFDRLLAQTVRG